MRMSSKTYDILKWIAWLWAPLFTLVTALVNIWMFESKNFEQIVATLVAIDTFIGAIVGISNFNYNKGNEEETE